MRRVLTAAALIPPVVYITLWSPYWAVFTVVAVVACLCYYEYSGIAARFEYGSVGPLGYAAGLLLLAWMGEVWLLLTMLALLALTLAMRSPDLAHSLPQASLFLMGVIYIFGSWKCALLLRQQSAHWLMFVLLVNWTGDIGAYYVGKNFGRHKLAPRVSPGKTWEGAAGSVVSATLIAGYYLMRFLAVPLPNVILLTMAANVAGQLGDLAESAMKRGAGVKDSGTILPGHGGFLDRVDSTLFSLPVVYACLRLM